MEKIAERSKIVISSTQIHDHLRCWLGTGTSIKSGGVKLILSALLFACYQTNLCYHMLPIVYIYSRHFTLCLYQCNRRYSSKVVLNKLIDNTSYDLLSFDVVFYIYNYLSFVEYRIGKTLFRP